MKEKKLSSDKKKNFLLEWIPPESHSYWLLLILNNYEVMPKIGNFILKEEIVSIIFRIHHTLRKKYFLGSPTSCIQNQKGCHHELFLHIRKKRNVSCNIFINFKNPPEYYLVCKDDQFGLFFFFFLTVKGFQHQIFVLSETRTNPLFHEFSLMMIYKISYYINLIWYSARNWDEVWVLILFTPGTGVTRTDIHKSAIS